MYGLRQVYRLNKNLPFFKCKDLINNAKFALVMNETKGIIFTTLRRNQAKLEINNFLEKLKSTKKAIKYGQYFIILDNI